MAGDPTSFEVYVLQKGRWELHAHHPAEARSAAVAEAKVLETYPNIAQVKVVCDVFDQATGTSSEFEVYIGDEKDVPVYKPGRRRGGGGPSWMDEADSAPRRKKTSSGIFVFSKFLLAVLVSLLVAGMITWVLGWAIRQVPGLHRDLGSNAYTGILFFAFLISFVASAALSVKAFISKGELVSTQRRGSRKAQGSGWLNMLIGKPQDAEKLAREAKLRKRAEAAARRLKEEEEAAAAAEKEKEEEKEEEAAEEEEEEEEEVADGDQPLSAEAEAQKLELINFLSGGLVVVAASRPQLDKFNKFGIDLYLAGACEAMGVAQGLEATEIERVLKAAVEVLGTTSDQAEMFSKSYESYLIDPKYLRMIEAGRHAMECHLANIPDSAAQLSSALDGWNEPKQAEDNVAGTIAVMFTDIVGSTQMTQTYGDAAAQEVVRTHNRIVRAALTMFEGREVKHTGDGIMASFNNTANSVEAGMHIQRQVTAANDLGPEVPLGVKIGINAGEPIVEDDDLFGTTVQLSARIVDKAANYQVMVSDTVRGICQGKAIRFVNRGDREMKGFADPVTLFEAIWQEDAEAAAGAAPEAAAAPAAPPAAAP